MPTLKGDTYYIRRNLPGLGRVRRSLGTKSEPHARDLERMLVLFWASGRVGIVELYDAHFTQRLPELEERLALPDVPPLSAAIRETLKYKVPDVAPRTLRAYTDNLERFQKFVGDVPVDDALTDDQVQEYKAHRLETVSRDAVNNDLIALSVLASRAMTKGWITDRPKLKQYRRPKREVYLEPAQIRAYLGCLRPAFRPLMSLLVGTGMRLMEAETTRVCDVRFGEGCRISVQDSKTAEGIRSVYAPGWVAAVLQAHIEAEGLSADDRLFRFPRGTLFEEHHRARKLAGIAMRYAIKDHRHTFAVAMAKTGMPIPQIAGQLGHTDISVTMRYAKYNPEYVDHAPYFDAVEQSWGVTHDPIRDPIANPTKKRSDQ
jgi:integrase